MTLTMFYGDGMFDSICEYRTEAKLGWHIVGYIEGEDVYYRYDTFSALIEAVNTIQDEEGKAPMSWKKVKRIWELYSLKNFYEV